MNAPKDVSPSQGGGQFTGHNTARLEKTRSVLSDVAGLLGAREALILARKRTETDFRVEHRVVRAQNSADTELDHTKIGQDLHAAGAPLDLGVYGEERLVGCVLNRGGYKAILAFVPAGLPAAVWQAVLRLVTTGQAAAPGPEAYAESGGGQPPELAPRDVQAAVDQAYAKPLGAHDGAVAAKRRGFGGRWRRLGGREPNRALREEMHRALESAGGDEDAVIIGEAGQSDPLGVYAAARGWPAACAVSTHAGEAGRAGLILGFADVDRAEAAADGLRRALPGFAAWATAHKTGLWATARRTLRDHPKTARRVGVWALAAMAILALAPTPAVIRADAVLRPGVVHIVAAPFDGQLASILAGPGDAVVQGRVLARMDEQDLDLELSTVVAERRRSLTAENQARALGEVSRAAEASFDGLALDAEADLLRRRREQLELKSPVAGRILNDAFEGAAGAAVRRGDVLFEIATGDNWEVELLAPPWDASVVAVGARASMRFEAASGRTIHATVVRAAPQGQVRDGRFHVMFIAEVTATDDVDVLVAGLEGAAKIRAGWTVGAWRVAGPLVRRLRAWFATR